jgi:hypothetical protein
MSIRPAWAGAVVVAAGVAGFVAGVAGAGLEAGGFAVVLGAVVWASTGAVIRTATVANAARSNERIRALLQVWPSIRPRATIACM